MNYEEILLNYAKYFQQSDVVESAIRTVGWKLILLLRGICDACQSVWEAVFRVLSFTQVISEKLGTYYPIWNAIFLVTILAVGTVFLYSERRPPFLKNLIITMAVVSCFRVVFSLEFNYWEQSRMFSWRMAPVWQTQPLSVIRLTCCI